MRSITRTRYAPKRETKGKAPKVKTSCSHRTHRGHSRLGTHNDDDAIVRGKPRDESNEYISREQLINFAQGVRDGSHDEYIETARLPDASRRATEFHLMRSGGIDHIKLFRHLRGWCVRSCVFSPPTDVHPKIPVIRMHASAHLVYSVVCDTLSVSERSLSTTYCSVLCAHSLNSFAFLMLNGGCRVDGVCSRW